MPSGIKQYSHAVPKWFESLAHIEALMSLAILKVDQFDVVLPRYSETENIIIP